MACIALQNIDNTFQICFHSEMCAVKQITCDIIHFLMDNIPSLTETDTFDLKLVYSELLVNAVIHGNKMDRNKRVHLYVETMDNLVYSVISDEGSGFDYKKVLSGIKSNNNIWEENGRGICLAYSLTDSLSYSQSGKQVTFYKRTEKITAIKG